MADPEDYRTKEEVAHWRERDPLPAFAALLEREGALSAEQRVQIERDAAERVDAAVRFAEESPFPEPHMLYEDVYVMDNQVHGRYHADAGENERRLAAAAGETTEETTKVTAGVRPSAGAKPSTDTQPSTNATTAREPR